MSTILAILMLAASVLFTRSCLVTLGFYKEPILAAFQQYGDEASFSPLVEAFSWGCALSYLIFLLVVPSSFLLLIGIKDRIMDYPQVFLRFPRWYRDIVDNTSREERRKLSYMWLGLPLRTRLLYNAHHEAFRKWVELVVLSVA